ncbi:hypothetical protein [Marinimicrobium sp. C2-29]|uniref:hypothetical protein n=1 Tax=Marinimicrobium sp. C2-29 TaxID=3139825 RepID=UPI003139289A
MPKTPSDMHENQVTPNPNQEKRTRQRFSTDYKLKIRAEAGTCQHGEVGQLLRRGGGEQLFTSQLAAGGANKLMAHYRH